jgi:hypothetical protein
MDALAFLLFPLQIWIYGASRSRGSARDGEAREFKFDPRLSHVTRRERREESSRGARLQRDYTRDIGQV